MDIKKVTSVAIPLLLMFAATTDLSFGQSLADFGIPASSDNADAIRTIQDPGAVKKTENEKLGEPVVSAATTQDAVNAAKQDLIESGDGARFIATGSGMGIVAVGMASYDSDGKNPNYVLLMQRRAYIQAFLKAKKEMANFMGGMSLEGRREIVKNNQMLDGSEIAAANSDSVTSEEEKAEISTMLRGVVIYDIDDDPAAGQVTVSVVTTPKTQGAVQATRGGLVKAGTLQAGLESVLNEINAGIMVPEGGRVVVVPQTGEIAWVGIGSEICRKNSNASMQRDLKLEARDSAMNLARRALLAVINGEDVTASSSENSEYTEQIKQFDVIVDAEGNEQTTILDQKQTQGLVAKVKNNTMGSTVVGKLPAGVSVKSYYSADGNWAYAVAVYMASSTEAAESVGKTMLANSPLNQRGKGNYVVEADGSFKRGPDGRLIPASMGKGRVTLDKDL